MPADDPQEALRGQHGVRLKADHAEVPAGTVVGPYRGHVMFEAAYSALELSPPPGMMESIFRMQLDSYCCDYQTFDPYECAAALKGTLPTAKQQRLGDSLHVSGLGVANITALVNDPHVDPFLPDYGSMEANCHVEELAVGGWKFMFLVTMQAVKPGEVRGRGGQSQHRRR